MSKIVDLFCSLGIGIIYFFVYVIGFFMVIGGIIGLFIPDKAKRFLTQIFNPQKKQARPS